MYRNYLLLLVAVCGVALLTQYASAIPSTAIPAMGLELNKVIYSSGENVTIHVWGAGSISGYNGTIYLKILDATTDIAGTHVILQETQNLVNHDGLSDVRFKYAIPTSETSTTYRYLVQVYQNQTDCCPLNSAYFVTKEGAEKIVISDVKLLTPKVTPSETINFTAKVTDGLGNDMPHLSIRGDLPESNGGADYLFTDATYDNSTKLFGGSISVPKSWDKYANQLGQYHLRISVHASTDKGLIPVEYNAGVINIVGSTVPEFPYAIPILVISLASLLIFYRFKSISLT